MIALLCAHNFVNCHAVICLTIIYIFWRDTASELWIPVLFSYIVYNCFTSYPYSFARWSYFTLIIFYTCTINSLCSASDNLSVSLGQTSLFVIVCRSTSIIVNGSVDTLLSLLQVLLDMTTLVL